MANPIRTCDMSEINRGGYKSWIFGGCLFPKCNLILTDTLTVSAFPKRLLEGSVEKENTTGYVLQP